MNLGYEQIKALRILSDEPNIEGSALCAKADCSFEELFVLADNGLIDIGNQRLQEFRLHPVITEAGRTWLRRSCQQKSTPEDTK